MPVVFPLSQLHGVKFYGFKRAIIFPCFEPNLGIVFRDLLRYAIKALRYVFTLLLIDNESTKKIYFIVLGRLVDVHNLHDAKV